MITEEKEDDEEGLTKVGVVEDMQFKPSRKSNKENLPESIIV